MLKSSLQETSVFYVKSYEILTKKKKNFNRIILKRFFRHYLQYYLQYSCQVEAIPLKLQSFCFLPVGYIFLCRKRDNQTLTPSKKHNTNCKSSLLSSKPWQFWKFVRTSREFYRIVFFLIDVSFLGRTLCRKNDRNVTFLLFKG